MIKPNTEPTETILELRYRPNARILDYRGTWAEVISAHMDLPIWNIVENRVDIHTKDKSQHVFVSFRNAGVVFQDVTTANLFPDKAQRFVRRLLSLEGFDNPLQVERLGVRHKVAIPFNGSFEALVEHVATEYLQLAPAVREAFGDARLVDVGAPLNYWDDVGHFNTSVGPMKEEQFKEFLRRREGVPEVGLYVDVDYWTRPTSPLSDSEICAKVSAFTTAAHRRSAAIRTLAMIGSGAQAS